MPSYTVSKNLNRESEMNLLNMNKVNIGSRWDGPEINSTIKKAMQLDLIDYLEVSMPQCRNDIPWEFNMPVLAHSTENPIASAYGLNPEIIEVVKASADECDSPWVGEHLCLLSPDKSGALGYIINPIFTSDFMKISVENIKKLQEIYNRPVAIELGPMYNFVGDYDDEVSFINDIAEQANCHLLFDISHFTVSNRNLGRPDDYGYEKINWNRVIEIHITGIKKSNAFSVWHDNHNELPNDRLLSLLEIAITKAVNLKAITLEVNKQKVMSNYINVLSDIRERVQRGVGV